MSITTVTAIGPDQAFLLPFIERWVSHQTRRPDQWLIVYDGDEYLPAAMGQQVIRRQRGPGEPAHTLPLNLKATLPHVAGDKILFLEVDDWYSPRFIEHYADLLNDHCLVGEQYLRVYNVPRRLWWRVAIDLDFPNVTLAQTGIRASALPMLRRAIEGRIEAGKPNVDNQLWEEWDSARFVFTDRRDRLCLHAGLKGLTPAHPDRGAHDPASRKRPYKAGSPHQNLARMYGAC